MTIVGSHLDSVLEGPGINDNGSGSAFNLELALQMAKNKIRTENRVRFAFWGAEESGLVGATRYVAAISDEEFAKIAANLNFDMLASPNHGKFVYDGDFSNTAPPATAPNVNPGAAYIESVFLKYFKSVGIAPDPTAFDGRSDYKPFQDNGIAAGGLFSGAEVAKSAAQAAKWGGMAGVAFDPNYHQAGDDIDNLDLTRLGAARRRRRPRAGDAGRGPRPPRHARRWRHHGEEVREGQEGQAPEQGPQGRARRVPRRPGRPLVRGTATKLVRGAAARPPLVLRPPGLWRSPCAV